MFRTYIINQNVYSIVFCLCFVIQFKFILRIAYQEEKPSSQKEDQGHRIGNYLKAMEMKEKRLYVTKVYIICMS